MARRLTVAARLRAALGLLRAAPRRPWGALPGTEPLGRDDWGPARRAVSPRGVAAFWERRAAAKRAAVGLGPAPPHRRHEGETWR
ncbi:MAG: hypothetical protein AB7U83_23430 [Vicinamibacterales bacterium]